MQDSEDLSARAAHLLEDLELASAVDVVSVRPLTGGVASDIGVVELADGRCLCVKFALPRLKVAEDWHAPVHRSRAEYAWLLAALAIVPECVPKLYGWSAMLNGFAMEYVSGPDVVLWKRELLAGAGEGGQAAAVGSMLGRVHAASTQAGFDRGPFANRDDFRALRIEPYLTFTARRHPEVAKQLTAMAEALYASDAVLVHGDVSPKNILFRGGGPMLLDAECATMGDPAFDVAFCLNHLVLKGIHVPQAAPERRRGAEELWAAYANHVSWEDVQALEARVTRLLPALMLARVDGKSPVEYLSKGSQDRVLSLALDRLRHPRCHLGQFLSFVFP